MAVETNKGDANVTPSPAQTLTGMAPINGTNGNGKSRRKRPSSLLSAGDSLPSVESSLDEFISRANQTLTDPDQWHAAENAAKQEDDARREQDLLRMRAAEQQMREGEAREQSLRRQLDGLQGRLAEAEARAAVAGSGSQDGVIADLKMRLTRSDEKLVAVEQTMQEANARASQSNMKIKQLTDELAAAKSGTTAVTQSPFYEGGDSDERVRVAEAKAQKAIAVARAAQAGLTVSSADIAAIESGLAVSDFGPQKSGTNWAAVAGAFVVGIGLMFGISKLMQKDTAPAPIAAPAAAAVAPAAAPAKPTVTPIEEAPAQQAAAQPAPAPAANAPTVTPIEKTEASAPVDTKAAAPAPAPVVEAPAPAPAPAPAQKHAAAPAQKHTAAPAKKAPAAGGIADPFGGGDAPAKAPAKKSAEKKPANNGAIVDPF
ncbi:MAG: hypothetical protein QM831_07360 [Kofleriaceae bacterium]